MQRQSARANRGYRGRITPPLALIFALAVLLSVIPGEAANGMTTRVSVASDGTQGAGNSSIPVIVGNGDVVAFLSNAPNLVPGDTNVCGVPTPGTCTDVFVRTLTDGTTSRINVGPMGEEANGLSWSVDVSADGRWVAFHSLATNLIPGGSSGHQIFVRDRQTNATTLVSSADDGTHGTAGSWNPAISGDGRYIAFASSSANLVPGDSNNQSDIFVKDRHTGAIERVNLTNLGQQAQGGSSDAPAISGDGRYVAFMSNAGNLTGGGTEVCESGVRWDILLRDRVANATKKVSVNFGGGQADGMSYAPSISADGRYVAFGSCATNLVLGDTNVCGQFATVGSCPDIFVFDTRLDNVVLRTTRVSVDSGGAQANNRSTGYGGSDSKASLSADGRFVAFQSWASNLVDNDLNAGPDVFLHDLKLHITTRASVSDPGSEAVGWSFYPELSANGRRIAFQSGAPDLVTNDTNDSDDIFVHTLADTDSDLEWEPFDICPETADCDGDSAVPPGYSTCIACPPGRFSDHVETLVGTDPTRRCSADTIANNEAVDAWPPDFNDNRTANLSDIILMGPSYNKSAPDPAYNPRYDLNASGSVNLSDVILFGPFYNKTCTTNVLVEVGKISDGDDAGPVYSNSEFVTPGSNVTYLATIDNDSTVPVTIQSLTDSIYPSFNCLGAGGAPVVGVTLAPDDGDGTASIDGGPDEVQCIFTETAPGGSGVHLTNTITATIETAGGSTASDSDSTNVTTN